jgi:hypothetical protein
MDAIIEDALRLTESARLIGLEIRLLGSVAVVLYCGSAAGRPSPVKDVDVVTVYENQKRWQRFLAEGGWQISPELLLVSERRETYSNQRYPWTLDTYYDGIDGNHRVDLRNRIGEAYPAVSTSDLVLTKLQRQSLRPEDVWDCCSLWGQRGPLDVSYIASALCVDWGFYTTATDNLAQIGQVDSGVADVIQNLASAIWRRPKSCRWHLRALIGRRARWWNEMYDASIRSE